MIKVEGISKGTWDLIRAFRVKEAIGVFIWESNTM